MIRISTYKTENSRTTTLLGTSPFQLKVHNYFQYIDLVMEVARLTELNNTEARGAGTRTYITPT